jgi:AP-1 complex subunit mu
VQVKEVNVTETKLEFVVKAKSHYRDRIVATWVELYIPVPPDSQNIVTKGTQGAIKYEPDKNALKWRVK